MNCIRIRNWEKWQSWRSDRGQPPWIKIHRCVMRNAEWVSLSDGERGQIVSMWLLAADNNGVIPTPTWHQDGVTGAARLIRKLCFMENEPPLERLAALGFIEYDANATPERRQDDANVTRQNRIDQIREDVDQIREDNIPQSAGECSAPTSRKSTPKRNGTLTQEQQAWFDEFWSRYPRKKDKGSALKAWAKLHVDAETWAAMLATFEWQIPEMQRKDISYVKYPATYLNARGWESEPDKNTFAKSAGVFVDPNDSEIPF